MSRDEASGPGDIDYAVREYNRIRDEARRGERSFDRDATLRALAAKTGLTLEELQRAIPT